MIIPVHLSIFVMMLVAIHINTNINNKQYHNRILTLLLFTYLLQNILFISILVISPEELLYIYLAAPFGLMYGPLMFFYYMSLCNRKMSKTTISIHLIPIIIAWIVYFIFIVNVNIIVENTGYYYPILYGCIGISCVKYSIGTYIFDYKNKYHLTSIFLLMLIGIVMICLSFELFFRKLDIISSLDTITSLTLTLFMVVGGLLILDEVIRLFTSQYQAKSTKKQNPLYHTIIKEFVKNEDYRMNSHQTNSQSTSIKTSRFIIDRELIENFFIAENIVDITMDLCKAAEILEISQNKLQNLIHIYYGVTFSKILALKRVEYACKIILDNETSAIPDNLYQLCGFNSMSTFYRNFNTIMGCSPSQYKALNHVSGNHC